MPIPWRREIARALTQPDTMSNPVDKLINSADQLTALFEKLVAISRCTQDEDYVGAELHADNLVSEMDHPEQLARMVQMFAIFKNAANLRTDISHDAAVQYMTDEERAHKPRSS